MVVADDTALIDACAAGDLEEVYAELKTSDEIDAQHFQEPGNTALHAAIQGGYTNIVKVLLKRGADPNVKNNLDLAPLFDAALMGNSDAAKMLLDGGANLNAQDPNGQRPLFYACRAGKLNVVKLLITKGANAKARDKKDNSTLMEAARSGVGAVIKFLLGKGVSPKEKNSEGMMPLHIASSAENEDPEVIQALIEKGADPNEADGQGNIPIIAAAKGGRMITLTTLLEKGASVAVVDGVGRSALHYAAEEGNTELVTILCKAEADLKLKDSAGESPMDIAKRLFKDSDETVKTMRGLLEGQEMREKVEQELREMEEKLAKEKAEQERIERETVGKFRLAQRRNKTPAMLDLLDTITSMQDDIAALKVERDRLMAEREYEDSDKTVYLINTLDYQLAKTRKAYQEELRFDFFESVKEGFWENIISVVKNRKLDPSVRDNLGWTGLHWAACRGQLAICKILVELGADVNMKNVTGKSPLHMAATNGHKIPVAYQRIVTFLVEKGADVNALDNENKTPLQLARANGHDFMASFLLTKGAMDPDSQ